VESSVVEKPESGEAASSFTKSLLLGEIHEEMVFPWPQPHEEEQAKVRELIARAREIGGSIDHREVEERRWIGDKRIIELGEAGLCGLYVDPKYGGQGLSQTGYARVFETLAQIDGTLSIILGVHQSIGYKGIVLFGTEEQKERWLPDLATGRKLAGFALTEPQAGSDAYQLQSRAVLQPDGSWVLNGEKRYIGNGSKGDVFTAFARAEVDGKDRHIALILEKGMKGFEVGERYDTMGLRGNDLRRLYFNDVRVPAENVLGEPGDGFRIAQKRLGPGRIHHVMRWLGQMQRAFELMCGYALEREVGGAPLAEKQTVQNWIADSAAEIQACRLLTLDAARKLDEGDEARVEVSLIKFYAARVLNDVIDRAIQTHGARGLTDETPLAGMYAQARGARIYDGPDEVHRMVVSRRILREFADGGTYRFG
jgi:acyl-CoA dehydrogenase family member 9